MEQLYSYSGLSPCYLPSNLTTKQPDGTRLPLPINILNNHGWYLCDGERPQLQEPYILVWTGIGWSIVTSTPELMTTEWPRVQLVVNKLLESVAWRYTRLDVETRSGTTPTDSVQALDAYVSQLLLVKTQPNPFAITWPVEPAC